jgi:hypothetical protein
MERRNPMLLSFEPIQAYGIIFFYFFLSVVCFFRDSQKFATALLTLISTP